MDSSNRSRLTRQQLHENLTFGQHMADAIASAIGSWNFIIAQNGFMAVWAVLNVVSWLSHWDPYPFILLNLIMSWEAANNGSILQMSANRQAEKDRARDDLEAEEVSMILEGMQLLNEINQQQLEILHQQNEVLALLQKEKTSGG